MCVRVCTHGMPRWVLPPRLEIPVKRILSIIGCLPLLLLLLSGPGAAPASAGTCTATLCGSIRHYSPDDGYDDPILIRCDYGVPATNHLLYEGETSTKYCKDTDQVYTRTNEEIWCKYPTPQAHIPGFDDWVWIKKFDAQGWHKINDIWDDGQGCTLRRD